MTFVIGLTGSIGMGKSTTAKMFSDMGVPVWDADAVVRGLYDKGGAATELVRRHYPEAIESGAVSRDKLRELIAANPKTLDHLQSLVHPLLAENRSAFLKDPKNKIVLLDIPLLFETGTDTECDAVVVVTAPADIQRQRVLDRGEMTEEDFQLILSRQLPDTQKRERARWIIETLSMDAARQSVKDILAEIKQELEHA
ncbi:dephospho-CoA kinase [Octadecabacter sp. 1_MG-2023]|uniref:dephospho-CoA kinase n=1 Tax=unclassified Octadecabacter TaxID=196158 RepID=UPI001C08129C|nr:MULTISPECIES: dephospho-CoA kinase [unclassified Octadecabacter]MBU2992316.1 dephospho-CoA kinase [Octadecabacter sp. B2R22]MDO6734927.1 dephospho-CoA kinase [Octadecabacter sp. 1_MG-2023]